MKEFSPKEVEVKDSPIIQKPDAEVAEEESKIAIEEKPINEEVSKAAIPVNDANPINS